MASSSLLTRLKLQNPIILAPLAGGPSTPELAAAVSNAGGLGSLGLEYLTLDQIRAQMKRFRELSRGPLNANLFAPVSLNFPAPATDEMKEAVANVERELGIASLESNTGGLTLDQKVEAVLEGRPEVFSFTFGLMPSIVMDRAKAAGAFIVGTATTAREAAALAASGVDAIVAQGSESGGHRGSFLDSFETGMVPTLQLVHDVRQHVNLPVIASGGIMDGISVRRALEAGAEAVQLGTIFLTCPEAGTSKPYREALLQARADTTMITRAFSGRPARGLRNAWASRWEHKQEAILPFPQQNSLTRAMRKAAGEQGRSEFLSLWAGTGVAKTRSLPAGELVRVLVEEMKAAEEIQKS